MLSGYIGMTMVLVEETELGRSPTDPPVVWQWVRSSAV